PVPQMLDCRGDEAKQRVIRLCHGILGLIVARSFSPSGPPRADPSRTRPRAASCFLNGEVGRFAKFFLAAHGAPGLQAVLRAHCCRVSVPRGGTAGPSIVGNPSSPAKNRGLRSPSPLATRRRGERPRSSSAQPATRDHVLLEPLARERRGPQLARRPGPEAR